MGSEVEPDFWTGCLGELCVHGCRELLFEAIDVCFGPESSGLIRSTRRLQTATSSAAMTSRRMVDPPPRQKTVRE